MRLMSDRIQEFIDWLEKETDFGVWDEDVRIEVHKKLIECIISDPHPVLIEPRTGKGSLD